MSRSLVAWLVLLAALAVGLASLWFTPQGEPRRQPWQPPPALVPELPALPQAVPPSADVSIIAARPLFAADRRPPPPPAAPPQPDPLANIQLLGLLTGDYAGVIAQVDGRSRQLRLNDTLGSWTLAAVEGRRATFKRGEEERQLELAFSRLGAAPTGTSAAAATVVPAQATAPGAPTAQSSLEDARRDRLRRRNEIRARAGLPPLPE